ncbi:MAG: phosphoglycerate mutase family protein [Burkholderiaceae bacterium]|nr:phosphoglycerate mutase family protein [Burkholderiaceae bacterium]
MSGEGADAAPAEPTRVVLLRHGETAWNAELRIQGHFDEPLNERGRWQAERAGAALRGEGLARIYSSDLARARQTAEALARASGVAEVHTDPALRERALGRFEGLTYAECESRWPDDVRRWRAREPGFAPGGGETVEAFYARCVPCAAAIAARHPGETVAVVAHGGVLDCLYRAATGADLRAPRTWQLGNAAINRLLWHGEGFVLVGWNDDAHLVAG